MSRIFSKVIEIAKASWPKTISAYRKGFFASIIIASVCAIGMGSECHSFLVLLAAFVDAILYYFLLNIIPGFIIEVDSMHLNKRSRTLATISTITERTTSWR